MDYRVKSEALTQSAESIRSKSGSSASIPWDNLTGFKDAIDAIPTGGGSVTVSPLSVTANGTYTAPSGEAYSPVTVNVSGGGGGASNVVTGTFTGTTTGAAMDVTLNYSGSGYPIAVMIYPDEGSYNPTGTFYNLVQRYAVHSCMLTKSLLNEVPQYPTSNEGNSRNDGVLLFAYKNSTSNNTTYSRSVSFAAPTYYNMNAQSSTLSLIRIRSATKFSVYIASDSYGFAANITYKYWVIYSS